MEQHTHKPVSKLGVGPMSPEIVEAVYRFSEQHNEPLMLIASKNQVDWNGGYVNNWKTKEFVNYTREQKAKYPNAKVYIARDHCGPGFKNDDLEDVYHTIDDDLANGFDIMHIDFCHYKGSYDEKLEESKKAIEHTLKQSPNTIIEVGTDENAGDFLTDLNRIESQMIYFKNVAPIHFFVCQTGSLTKEVNQVGGFNEEFLKQVKEIAVKHGVFLKEHNGDYIDREAVKKRVGIIDAMNVAPQYGTIQTMLTLTKCYTYGISADEFLEDSYQSGKWKKWLQKNDEHNKYLCSVIAGHYNFTKDSYKKIYEKISTHENFRETIIQEMMKNISIYINP